MCTVTVKGCAVRVDGIQVGSTYSNHETAIHQGKYIHEKHYPQAKFEIIPEPPKTVETKKRKYSKKEA